MLCDSQGRRINYLRLSVTDRCNLGCLYCMPRDRKPYSDRILTFEDIGRIVRILAALGITKLRLTGGEPLARKEISSLIGMLSSIVGISKIASTTNGTEMAKHANELKTAGLTSVNIHLDSLNPSTYRLITGCDSLDEALKGINSAISSGLEVKLNTVLMRGINDTELDGLIEFASGFGLPIRFIELMPMGATANFCNRHFISTKEILARLSERHTLSPIQGLHNRGPATYYKIEGSNALIGFIGCLSNPFCSSCNRLRLLSNGTLMNCIADCKGLLLTHLLGEANDREIAEAIGAHVISKPDDHAGFIHAGNPKHFEMHTVGG